MTKTEHRELAAIAREIAIEGGDLAMKAFSRPERTASHKGAVDLVTETDIAVERLITERLRSETGLSVLGEEEGRTGTDTGATWVVDPIDGTTNFAHRVPHFAISIGLWLEDGPLLGVVRSPAAAESFWCDGERAFLNDTRLPKIAPSTLGTALLASGFPYDRQVNPDNNLDLWEAFMLRCQGVRRYGAAALDLAWVAAGRIDGFWEPRLRAWDFAAGVALVRCAGGVVTEYQGGPIRLDSESLVAAGSALHAQMLELISAQGHR
jgi:myo-inositol-1(or 4)-monophosphatase